MTTPTSIKSIPKSGFDFEKKEKMIKSFLSHGYLKLDELDKHK